MFELCSSKLKNVLVSGPVVVALALSFFFASSVQADPESLQRLHDKLQDMRSFQAEFTQTVLDGGGSMMQTTQGKIAVKRPGLLYWQVYAPLEQLLVSDGV